MLSDKTLMYIALVLFIVGIAGLFLVTQFIGPKEIGTGKIGNSEIGQNVVIKGTIASYFEKDGHVFMDVDDGSGKIKVVMFENAARNQPYVYNIEKGDMISVEGKIELYENELEIVANSIKTI
jgi:DNA/RNA endonuclease YhcR with UshA esterase domain